MTTSSSYTPFTSCPIETLYLGRNISYYGTYSPFRGNNYLTSLTIGDKVTSIGAYEFDGCSYLLGELVIPNSVLEIKNNAFQNCTGLTILTLKDGEETLSMTTSSSNTPFTSCPIDTLYLGRDISFNDNYSPFRNTNLTSLTIGESVTCIPSKTFSGCTKLIDITALCSTPPTIYSDTFSDVESVEAPKGALLAYATADYWYYIRKIYAENDGETYYPVPIICEGNTIVTADGGSVSGIEAKNGAIAKIVPLSGSSQVEGLVVYQSENIEEEINRNGSSSLEVTEFHLANRVYTYGFGAEHYFDITVPSAGQLLEELTVYNVPMVYGLKVTGEVNGTDIMTIRKMPYIQQLDLSDATIVSGGDPYYDYYKTTNNVIGKYFFIDMPNLKYVKLPKGVTTIEDYAFSDLTGLTGISIPGSVTLIEEYAFKGCSCLASLALEDGTETLTLSDVSNNSLATCPFVSLYLGRNLNYSYSSSNNMYYYSPFKNKTMLTSLTISNSVTEIGEDEFSGCTGLTEVTIPESIITIGNSAFANCTHISNINFNAIACTSSGSSSYPIFKGCTNLTNLTIGDAVTTIPAYLFYNCSTLMGELLIPNSVLEINEYAFYGCSGIDKVTIGDGVIEIRESAFYHCSNISDVSIGNSVTTIGSSAFQGCSGLTSIVLPNSTKSINSYAFSGCSEMTEATLGDGVESIDAYAFSNCTSLAKVSIGKSAKTIGRNAFYNCSQLIEATIGESVSYIGSCAFSGCSQLSTINSKNPTPPNITSDTFDGVDKGTCVLNVPIGSINDYWIHLYWGLFFHINEVDFGYEELKEEIETTQDLLEDVWDTINSDYSDVVNEFMNEYENLKKQLEELLEVLEIAYRNGDLTDEKIAEIRQELEEIKQKIDELLAAAKSSSKFTDIDNIHSNVDDNVQIYNLSGSRVNTPRKGNVYIFRFSDGSTKKVFIK